MKTIKIKIAVAVDTNGKWAASGWGVDDKPTLDTPMNVAVEGVEPGEHRYWVEAEVQVPETSAIQGEVFPGNLMRDK